jgi:hypothetical protein
VRPGFGTGTPIAFPSQRLDGISCQQLAPFHFRGAPELRRHGEQAGVLKITRLSGRGRVRIIKLEGEVLGPWVGAVRDACTQQDVQSKQLVLDLTAVSYVDGAGSQLLRDLVGEGVQIGACSSFLAELLGLEE